MKLSIIQKVALIATLVAIAVASIIGFISIQSSKSIIEQRMIESELPSKVKEIKNYLSKEINILLMASEQLSGNQFLLAWAAQNQPQDDALLVSELNRLTQQYGLATASWANRETNNYWNQQGFLKQLNQQQDGWYYAFKNSGNRYSISIYQESATEVSMYVNHQQINGVGLAGLAKSISQMQQMLKQFSIEQTGSVFIVDKTGLVKLHTDTQLVAKVNLDQMYGQRVQTSLLNGREFSLTEIVTDQQTLLVGASPIENTDLYVIAQVPKHEVFSEIETLTWQIISFSVLVAFIASIVGWLLARSISAPLQHITSLFEELGQGDAKISFRFELNNQPELDKLGRGFNQFLDKIEQALRSVLIQSHDIKEASISVSEQTQRQTDKIHQQKEQTISVAAAINEMGAAIKEVAYSAANTAVYTDESNTQTRSAQQQVEQTQANIQDLAVDVDQVSHKIDALALKTKEIGSIVDVIRGISDQTNLLALNAAIESARAGEHGRGFAVVADEVRALAKRTSQSTTQIQQMIDELTLTSQQVVLDINTSKSNATQSVDSMAQTVEQLTKIVGNVGKINDMATIIATATDQQTNVVNEVNQNIEMISSLNEESINEQLSVQVAIESLSSSAQALDSLVDTFNLER